MYNKMGNANKFLEEKGMVKEGVELDHDGFYPCWIPFFFSFKRIKIDCNTHIQWFINVLLYTIILMIILQ